jgi:hypothetical protein
MDNEPDFLSMSDEEVANMPFPPMSSQEEPTTQEQETSEEQNVEESSQSTDNLDNSENSDNSYSEEEVITEETNVEQPSTETSGDEPNYKELYNEVFKPFKANGKEIQVESPEDVRQLMQMGANYNKKMAALKPHLKIVKMLENNGLLDEAKLSYLIDLDKKNPKAIAKLVGESQIDPMDLDVNSGKEYAPNTYTVSDGEMALEQVLSDIRDTSAYSTTLDVVNNKWDDASRRAILSNPESLKVINNHIEAGVYDKVMAIVDRERLLGRLQGVSDIDAYKQIGTAMQQQGHFGKSQKPQMGRSNVSTDKQQTMADKKKAAAVPTGKGKQNGPSDNINPLEMSDEEFEKYAKQHFKHIR